MEEMTSRDRLKETHRVGNHPGKWLTDTERFRIVERQVAGMRELAQKLASNPDGAHAAWMKQEGWLFDYCHQLTVRLRDRLPPVVQRKVSDFLECVESPEDLSSDPFVWGILGALDALTAMYGAMVSSRIACGRVHQATGHLDAAVSAYRAKAYGQYADVHEQCLALCSDADPTSFFVSIDDKQGYPALVMTYRPRQGLAGSGAGEGC